MEKLNLPYSLKNIPAPTRIQYQKQMIAQATKVITRMKWKVFHTSTPTDANNTIKASTFGFKSNNSVPHCNDLNKLKAFSDDFTKLISNIEYYKTNDPFQNRLRDDVNKIKSTKEVIVFADKSANLYKVPVTEYRKNLADNITKDYKKVDTSEILNTNIKAAEIAKKLKVDDRAEILSESPGFITIKDHKPDFPGRVACRLINPSKSDIGIISKHILEKINAKVKSETNSNQWRSTNEALEWFNKLENKSEYTFLQYDIEAFYPSISETLLKKAIAFAKEFTQISSDDIDVIMNSRQTFLFSAKEPWVKKDNPKFDVSMGGNDSAEICELVGLYILNGLEKFIPQPQGGLYRDDGLQVHKLPGPELERLKKKIIAFFKDHGLKITIDANIKKVNFLDATLDLESGTHKPYRKENSPHCYIDTKSCHPPSIIKQLPNTIEKRLSYLSSNEQLFDSEKPIYEAALKSAGYNTNLKYSPPNPNQPKKDKRKRNIIWYNPPFNSDVKTNVAKEFLRLIDKHFPRNSDLHKNFNRNNVKVSYSCMPNMSSIIASHNKKILGDDNIPTVKTCNCNAENICPLDGKCLTKSIVYKATVQAGQSSHTYIGISSNTFKSRYATHKHTLKKREKQGTGLSEHIWKLRDRGTSFNIRWSIEAFAPTYSQDTNKCQLCLTEKVLIMRSIKSNQQNSLNKRSEFFRKCIHRKFVLLKHVT
jgi:hypothetical protein